MIQSELDVNYQQVILTYLWNLNNSTKFQINLIDVCIWNYNNNGNFYIISWLIPDITTWPQPTNDQLLEMNLSTCLATYENVYNTPLIISTYMTTNYINDTSVNLAALYFVGSGGIAFDTTQNKLVYCLSSDSTGTIWNSFY